MHRSPRLPEAYRYARVEISAQTPAIRALFVPKDHMTPSPNTDRFEKLANFLEQVMTDPKASRRVRLSAAQRLSDLMLRKEKAEAREARRVEREALRAAKAQEEALQRAEAVVADTPEDNSQLKRAQAILSNISRKTKETIELSAISS